MRLPDEAEESAWELFDARLRAAARAPEPPDGLRAACLPGTAVAAPAFRVLVVDDEPHLRRLVEVHLARAGYQVRAAEDGPAAWRAIQAERPDVVVLDVSMPGPSGFEVLEHIKADPATADILVVMLTARSGDDPIRRGWETGADFYMTKPFNPHELCLVVDRLTAVLGTPENPPPLRLGHK
jgi:DNA-binding response OmpR family regulator